MHWHFGMRQSDHAADVVNCRFVFGEAGLPRRSGCTKAGASPGQSGVVPPHSKATPLAGVAEKCRKPELHELALGLTTDNLSHLEYGQEHGYDNTANDNS